MMLVPIGMVCIFGCFGIGIDSARLYEKKHHLGCVSSSWCAFGLRQRVGLFCAPTH